MIIDGKKIAAQRRAALAERAKGKQLAIGVILSTDNPAVLAYVSGKRRAAEEVGYQFVQRDLGPTATQADIVAACHELNQDDRVTGYIPQMPMAKGVDHQAVISEVDPRKDADGLTPGNLGYLLAKQERILPATPKGILSLLEAYNVPISGQTVAVIGKSTLVGLPIAVLLANRGATVTSCDSKTRDLPVHTRQADIIVTAAGVPGLVKGEMIKQGAVVIDVGISQRNGKLVGDVDFASVEPKAKAVTPVPGGVGPMTVVSLLENVYELSTLG